MFRADAAKNEMVMAKLGKQAVGLGIAEQVEGPLMKDDLMVRLDHAVYDAALKKKGCREMDITGKPMRGFVFVSPEGFKTKRDLDYWVELALDFNKKAKASQKRA